MIEPKYHRGAVVSVRSTTPRIPSRGVYFQWDDLRDKSSERTVAQLAAVSKPSRQRRKGPITRYGVQR